MRFHSLFLASAALVAVAAAQAPAEPGTVASGDGHWMAHTESKGQILIIEEAATGTPVHRRVIETRRHAAASVASLLAVPARRSFLVALEGFAEIWEIALFPEAGPFHEGFVHSWEAGMEESLSAESGLFARQRIILEAPLVALALAPDRRNSVIGTRADGTRVEINLTVRREVAILPPE